LLDFVAFGVEGLGGFTGLEKGTDLFFKLINLCLFVVLFSVEKVTVPVF
jgi:hypothetical protein